MLIGTVTDGNGLVIEINAEQVNGSWQLTVSVVEGYADLRGFFMDLDSDSSNDTVTQVGGKDNNMKGSGEAFDAGYEIGTAGIGKDDISSYTVTLPADFDINDLDDLSFGVRATSVGESREDSVKLVGTFDIPEPPVVDNFPTFDKDISHVTLYFDTTSGDVNGETVPNDKGNGTHQEPDGYYTVKIDNWQDQSADGSDDLDDYLGDILTYLVENDPNITEDTELLGVAIKGGNVDNGGYDNYYAMDGDTDAETPPTGDLVQNKEIDATYQYEDVFGTVPA